MFDIVLHQGNFGGNVQSTISARELYEGLGIKGDFTSWLRDQIKARELIENKDFIVFMANHENPKGGRPRTECFFTIKAAKHIAAMSRSDGGEEYREALFNLEESVALANVAVQYQATTRTPERLVADRLDMWIKLGEFFQAPRHIVLIEAAKDIKLLGVEATALLQASPAMDNIHDDQEMLEPTELAKRLGFSSGRAMNNQLRDMRLQARINGEWVPTDAAVGMFFKHSWTKGSKSGCNLKWNLAKVKTKLEAYTESYSSI